MSTSKVTLYVNGSFGYTKIEGTDFSSEVAPYAQYTKAVRVEYKPKGKRKMRAFVQAFEPSLLVLEGWGVTRTPQPDDLRED